MTYFHLALEVIGAASILGSILLIIVAYGTGRRNSLDHFNGPVENFRFSKIVPLPRKR